MTGLMVAFKSTFKAATNGFAVPGYAFTGWNTAADGSGTAFSAGATVPVEFADVTLYAQWVVSAPHGRGFGLGDTTIEAGGSLVPPVISVSIAALVLLAWAGAVLVIGLRRLRSR